jgi:probable rRNA maturation factor
VGSEKEESLLVKLDIALQLKDARWKSVLRPYCKTVEDVCSRALKSTDFGKKKSPLEMAVVLADDKTIRGLNRDFRGIDKPTNVLSFPGEKPHLGDIVLAFDTVEREAKAQKKSVRHHALHLLVHGTLHLAGFDHANDKDAARMEGLEIKILAGLGVCNPYL